MEQAIIQLENAGNISWRITEITEQCRTANGVRLAVYAETLEEAKNFTSFIQKYLDGFAGPCETFVVSEPYPLDLHLKGTFHSPAGTPEVKSISIYRADVTRSVSYCPRQALATAVRPAIAPEPSCMPEQKHEESPPAKPTIESVVTPHVEANPDKLAPTEFDAACNAHGETSVSAPKPETHPSLWTGDGCR